MPFEHIIDHENRCVVVRGSGEYSIDEIARSARLLCEDKTIETDYNFMIIANDIAFHPTTDQMWSIVSLLKMMLSRFSGCMAIITSKIGHVTEAYLVAFAADKTGGRVRVFTSEHQARQWLLGTALT